MARRPVGKRVGRREDFPDGAARKFSLRCRGESLEGFVFGFQGELFAYVNRCRHVSLPLDWVDSEFFTEDERYLICANHGALYEPTTGECLWGPCHGEWLRRVPLKVEAGTVRAFCPEDD
ncbi:MAG: Rieske 2Fe-2S domain-containing protein [Deltaproteobacteria bacterium]|nr:Rieske 2Fe-2S domain-containing protein [Deltaproteobacteria bacterium]